MAKKVAKAKESKAKAKTRKTKAEEVTKTPKKEKVVEKENDESKKVAYGKGIASPIMPPGIDVDQVLDNIEKKIGISSIGMGGAGDVRMSTGLLMLDLVLGGGITAGWYTNFGEEQSTKSTTAMAIMAYAITQNVPILAYADYEGSSQPNYIQNMLNTLGVKATVEDVFGVRDRSGEYIKRPRVRYLPTDTAEQFFDYLAMLERTLPDKIYQSGQWWYVYEHTKENQKMLKTKGIEYDAKLFRKYNKFYVPAPDGSLQALLITDSYPAMLPDRLDVDDPGAGLAAVARMFAEQLPRVKGKLRRKRIAVIGVNQLRDVPMARYGPPKKQAAGNAVRYYSDVRIEFTSRALSAVPEAKKSKDSPFEEEPSVEYEGKDIYRYISIKGEKNKFSQPHLKGWLRLWIEDANGDARGFDPVFDTYEYLKSTGQAKGNRKKLLLQFKGNEAKKPIEWLTFKKLILGNKSEIKDICTKIGMKPCFLRKLCLKQVQSGKGVDMYFETRRAKAAAKGVGSDDDDDSDD